jgi:YHYH protein
MKTVFIATGSATILSMALKGFAGDPQLTSWFTVNSGKAARIYRTDADRAAGQSVTTWSNGRQTQAQPAFSGVQQILVSSNWIYIRSTGLGSQVMGPWYLDAQRRFPFPNLPTDQHYILRLPRHPVVQSARSFNPLGEIGMFVDGVRMFDATDAFSYSTQFGRDADPRAGIGQGDQIWDRDAWLNEGITFDAGLGHQQNWGRYHYHASPMALRYLLGDHVDFDPQTKMYRENSGPPSRHSPILGWMHDGYPIYGPYGYANATNAHNAVRRMISGFVLRNGANGADDLAQTGRRSLPAWDARELQRSPVLNAFEFGPNVNATYPLGHYLQDYAFLGDLGRIQGRDFDLDELNGRWCVTPEFPNGTYAYFTTIDVNGRPAYPYNMGRRYHGQPAGRLVSAISEPVTTFFARETQSAPEPKPAAHTVSLIWQGDTGYQAQTK